MGNPEYAPSFDERRDIDLRRRLDSAFDEFQKLYEAHAREEPDETVKRSESGQIRLAKRFQKRKPSTPP